MKPRILITNDDGVYSSGIIAASHGIPAFHEGFDVAKKVVRRIAAKVITRGLPQNVDLLNINFPARVHENTDARAVLKQNFNYTSHSRFNSKDRV